MPHTADGHEDAIARSFKYRASFNASREREADKAVSTLRVYMRSGLNQIVFVMDATGSMRGYITDTKKCICDVSERIESEYNTQSSFAVVVYRDHCDGDRRIKRMPSFGSARKVAQFLSTVVADGGGDGPEDCFGGLLEAACCMPWESPQRLLIWIGDAPQHGRRYHSFHDDYPTGCPLGVTAERVARAMVEQNIRCHFLEVSEDTRQMISVLTGEFSAVGAKLTSEPMDTVEKTLMETLSRSASATVSQGAENAARLRGLVVDFSAAVPESADRCPVTVYTFRPSVAPPSGVHPLELLLTRSPDVHEQAASLTIAERPFAEGEFRCAFHAAIHGSTYFASWHGTSAKVAKCSRFLGESLCLRQVSMQCCAIFLAREFCARLDQRDTEHAYKRVEYVPAQLVRHQSEDWLVEPYITGTFRKFNNNNGTVMDAALYPEPQAFTHFTSHFSGGRAMVTDVQGIVGEKCYTLTDPAIHTAMNTNELREKTNMGTKGMVAFYKTHKCNDVCRLLGLPDVPADEAKLEAFVNDLALHPRPIAPTLADHADVEATAGV